VLLSRTQEKLDSLASEINENGGEVLTSISTLIQAIGIATDLNSEQSVAEVTIASRVLVNSRRSKRSSHSDHSTLLFSMLRVEEVRVVNTLEHRFLPFLWLRMRHSGKPPRTHLRSPHLIHSKGGFLFSQHAIPLLIETAKSNPKYPPTLLFTGATASIKASNGFSAFASAKWALRALSQSLAKEFGPQGVHVGHIVADGVFDTPIRKQMSPDDDGENWMSTDAMAQSYWALHTQPKRAWSWEIDLRPYLVRFIPRHS
jgi:NAD(P)-dependent dehydrogenase (short-subunit alcohol dehydrogenase family)